MFEYKCKESDVIMSERVKQDLRCNFYKKKDFVLRLFGEERNYNIAMLCGEVNVLQGIGVYTEEVADKIRRDLVELL